MTILYINNELCRSLAQLRGYFNLTLNPLDEVYQDLLDYGRDHIISEWLQDQGETELAMLLENVDSDLCDSEYFAKMSSIILEREDIEVPVKTDFSQCFTLDSLDQDEDAQGKQISVKLKVLLSVNEFYELRLQTSWGSKAINVNPFAVAEGDFIKEIFHFRKRPGKDFEVLGFFADGDELAAQIIKEKLQSTTSDDDFVDLGLSVKWAKCNLGAQSPEEYGNYYAWGEIEPKDIYYKGNSKTYAENMLCIAGNPQYDAATSAFGLGVRLPKLEEIQELKRNCRTKWTKQKGVKGRLFTSKINGNSIFFPASGFHVNMSIVKAEEYGCYWSSTPILGTEHCAYRCFFRSASFECGSYGRYVGHSVRPVREFKA